MGDAVTPQSETPIRPQEVKSPAPARRRGRWVWPIALAALLFAAATFSAQRLGWGAGRGESDAEIVRVRRGDVLKTLVVEGSVESARNIELKCQLAGGSTLLWIIPDGSPVREGDELARFDSSLLDEQVSAQTILVEQARAAKISAERSVSAAEISVQEYREGLYAQTRQQLELAALLAEHNLNQAENKLTQARKLTRGGFINAVQLGGEIDGLERAKLDLGVARRAIEVLDKFTKPKTIAELESLRDGAQATLHAAEATFDLESSRLDRLKTQLTYCVLRAPQDGMVIYANDPRSNSGDAPQIQEGANIRQHQTVLQLPNLDRMQVRALVHESQMFQLHPGLKARIRIQEHEYTGVVETLANQPERTRRSQPQIKQYAATVRIEQSPENLRPGQTAETEILLAHRDDVLTAPVTAVVQQGDDVWAWVQNGDSTERRAVKLGAVNEKLAEISSGLHEGDVLVSNPRVHLAEMISGNRGPRIEVVKRFGLPSGEALPARPASPTMVKAQPQTASGGG